MEKNEAFKFFKSSNSYFACRLIFAGKQMNDDKMAKEYNIEGGSVLHLVCADSALKNRGNCSCQGLR